MMDWTQAVTAERDRLGRGLSLSELLALAKVYKMTPGEAERQRKSLARGLMPLGDRCTAIALDSERRTGDE